MARTFDLKKFTNGLSSNLLQEYCKEKRIDFIFNEEKQN